MNNKRYNIFVSHSRKDIVFTNRLVKLLTQSGLIIWYDEDSLLPSTSFSTEIPKYIQSSEVLIVIISGNSCKSKWVEEEYNYAKELVYKNELKIIPIVIDGCEPPGFYRNYKWINCINGTLEPVDFFQILSAIYGNTGYVSEIKDIYVSYSWREEDKVLVNAVFKQLIHSHYRLIGDAADHYRYDEGLRIRRIMSTCGAFIGILPYRGVQNTSKYILDEINQAKKCGLDGLVISDSRVQDLEEIPYPVYKIDNTENVTSEELKDVITNLRTKRPQMTHVFFATHLSPERDYVNTMIRHLISAVTSNRCVLGEDINLGNLQQQIINRIKTSYVMIADITDERFNTCIEAGIARGAGIDLYLVAKKPRHTPPFMFRDMNVHYYEDDCELLAIIHKVLRPYRRKVLTLL